MHIYIKYFIFSLLFLASNLNAAPSNNNNNSASTERVTRDFFANLAREAEAEIASELDGLANSGITRDAQREKAAQEFSQGLMSKEVYQEKIKAFDRQQKAEDVMLNFAQQAGQTYLGLISSGAQTFQDITQAEANRRKEIACAAVQAEQKRKGQLDNLKHLTSSDVMNRTGVIVSLAGAGLILSYFSFKLFYNYVMTKMGVPQLVRETSIIGTKEKIYNAFLGNEKAHELSFKDLVVHPKLDEKVKAISFDATSNYKVGLPHKNLLLYGPPGTGKTTIAKLLARYTGMDYAIMSGADFAQFADGKDVEELHKLFDWAENSTKGLIIFIDEIDAFARDRAKASQRAVNLLNAFLSRTGELSTKFMIVGATNHRYELDSAFMSRMHKQLEVNAPGHSERIRLINTYLQKYISNDSRKIKDIDENEHTVTLSINNHEIDDSFIYDAALIIEGFTGRDIAFMVDEMRAACYRTEEYILSRKIFMNVFEQKVEQFAAGTNQTISIPEKLYSVAN